MKHTFRLFLILLICSWVNVNAFSQEDYKDKKTNQTKTVFINDDFYEVESFTEKTKHSRPKNVILLIGDGMGLSHIYSGITANKGQLYIQNFKNIGFCKTYSKSDYVTDSAASGTAIATGEKTYNGAIGVDIDKKPIKNVRERAEDKGMATGIVSTSAITHATPASFVAHQPKREMYEEIAGDFLKTNIDVFIGGGYSHFAERKDGKNLIIDLKNKGYKVIRDVDSLKYIKERKMACLTAPTHNPQAKQRNDMLRKASIAAIDILKKDKDGFFLMIEGSQIDWGAHQNDMTYIVKEVLDFDKTVGEVLKFAAKDKNTLVIVTADHETGGLAVIDGDLKKGSVEGAFTTGHHTGLLVPIFAFGPGSEHFRGFMENTEISKKIKNLLKLK